MDILFIIGMILFFALTTRKEKKEVTTNTNRPKGNVFGDEFPDIKEWSRPEPPRQKQQMSEPEPFLHEEMRESKPYSSTPKASVNPVVPPVILKEEEPCEEFNLQDADEARRAFIYSEIFTRKYE